MSFSDASVCERIARSHARTFTLAGQFLPERKRRAAFALYAFCRVADDIVDDADGSGSRSVSRRLADYERNLTAALAGRPSGAVFREVLRTVREFGVPTESLREVIAGVARDLAPSRLRTWAELVTYCQGVTGSVGEMCTYVFGVPDGDESKVRAIRSARTLGVAMQLTNILRDVGEDSRRGRCYLPADELARFGIYQQEVLDAPPALARDVRWRELMVHQIERTRSLYASATTAISLLCADSQRCVAACAFGYAGILRAIEANGYDTFRLRARLATTARLGILWRSWRGKHTAPWAEGRGPTTFAIPRVESW